MTRCSELVGPEWGTGVSIAHGLKPKLFFFNSSPNFEKHKRWVDGRIQFRTLRNNIYKCKRFVRLIPPTTEEKKILSK